MISVNRTNRGNIVFADVRVKTNGSNHTVFLPLIQISKTQNTDVSGVELSLGVSIDTIIISL